MSSEGLDEELLARKIAQGRGGDVRGMLGLPRDPGAGAFPAPGQEASGLDKRYEVFLALAVLRELGGDPEDDPVVWSVVHNEWLNYDDEGYLLLAARLDAAIVFSTDRLGLADPAAALRCWEEALAAEPEEWAENVRDELHALAPSMTPAVRAALGPLIDR
jgi:hypothetical protein